MIIQRSDLTLQSSQVYRFHRTSEQTVRAWVGPRPASSPRAPIGPAKAWGTTPDGSASPEEAGRIEGTAVQGRLATVAALIEWLTGSPVKVLDPSELHGGEHRHGGGGHRHGDGSVLGRHHHRPARPTSAVPATTAGWGLEVTSSRTTVESQTTTVAAAGAVTLTDGRRVDVAVDVYLNRESITSTSTRLRAGDAAVTDPLMLSLDGAAGFGSTRSPFDLDGDGVDEQMPDAAPGSAFLVLDRNGNGILDDGGELLGPATGDGFAELAGHDQDGNGWIDEGDPVYARLGLATTGHGVVTPLADAGVGAVGLARVTSPFTYTDGTGTTGVLRSTGVWIGENGSAGAVQQIDVAG